MLSSISLTRGKRPSTTQLGCHQSLPKHFTHFFCIKTQTLEHSYMSIMMFLVKKKCKNIVCPQTYCLIGNFNCSSSLCFNQFHQILIMSDCRIFVIKLMEYWNDSTLVEAIDAVINLSKSIIFQIHRFILSIDGYH